MQIYKPGSRNGRVFCKKVVAAVNIQLPEQVSGIIDTLQGAGFDAYAVGGCVRDSVLGRTPKDWDITTPAKPEEVKALFARTIDTGIAHGTVTVMIGREGYEVTTYRIDGEYLDARHPKEVSFTADLTEDLKRRDFTINAMAYNDREGLVDVFDGLGDLWRGVIRCVGDPTDRFGEDALRMMRAVRFAAVLGFSIEEETFAAIRVLAPNLKKVSAERIQTELVRLLVSPHPEHLRTLYESGITDIVLPEFSLLMQTPQHNPHHDRSVGEHTISSVGQISPDPVLRLTMLLHDIAKPLCITTDAAGVDHYYGHPARGAELAGTILRRLKFDNDTIRRVKALIRAHDDRPLPLTQRNVRRAVLRNGETLYPDLFAVKRADILAQSTYYQKEKLEYLDEYERIYREILEANNCLSLKSLAVHGGDLIAAGMKPGRELGIVLQSMLEDVIEEPELNKKEILLERWRQGIYTHETGSNPRQAVDC